MKIGKDGSLVGGADAVDGAEAAKPLFSTQLIAALRERGVDLAFAEEEEEERARARTPTPEPEDDCAIEDEIHDLQRRVSAARSQLRAENEQLRECRKSLGLQRDQLQYAGTGVYQTKPPREVRGGGRWMSRPGLAKKHAHDVDNARLRARCGSPTASDAGSDSSGASIVEFCLDDVGTMHVARASLNSPGLQSPVLSRRGSPHASSLYSAGVLLVPPTAAEVVRRKGGKKGGKKKKKKKVARSASGTKLVAKASVSSHEGGPRRKSKVSKADKGTKGKKKVPGSSSRTKLRKSSSKHKAGAGAGTGSSQKLSRRKQSGGAELDAAQARDIAHRAEGRLRAANIIHNRSLSLRFQSPKASPVVERKVYHPSRSLLKQHDAVTIVQRVASG